MRGWHELPPVKKSLVEICSNRSEERKSLASGSGPESTQTAVAQSTTAEITLENGRSQREDVPGALRSIRVRQRVKTGRLGRSARRKQAKQKLPVLKDEGTQGISPAVGCSDKTSLRVGFQIRGKNVAMRPEQLSECRQERCHGEKTTRLCACCHLRHG